MAKLIREDKTGIKKEYIYACCGCGVEVTLNRRIGERNTYCGKCIASEKGKQWDRYWDKVGREKERKRIIAMIQEIRDCHFYCMHDMCPAEDERKADCGRCALDWVLKRIEDGNG